jgi:hypothetical protein
MGNTFEAPQWIVSYSISIVLSPIPTVELSHYIGVDLSMFYAMVAPLHLLLCSEGIIK